MKKEREEPQERSQQESPEEGEQYFGVTKLREKLALAASDWPAFPEEEDEEEEDEKSAFDQIPRETWDFYRNILKKNEIEGWRLLKEHERWYGEQIEIAEEQEKEWGSHRELRSRIHRTKALYKVKHLMLRRFLRRYMMTHTVPGELSQKEAKELSEALPIGGYHAPGYATEAYRILQESSGVSTFTKLSAQMGTGGESKVDTLKRATGYDDLPREEKTFGKFKKLLVEKVRLREGSLNGAGEGRNRLKIT